MDQANDVPQEKPVYRIFDVPPYVDVPQMKQFFQIEKAHARRLAKKKLIKASLAGKKYVFPTTEVLKYLRRTGV